MVLAVIWLPHIVGGSDSEIELSGIPEELEVSELLAEGYLKADRVDTVVENPVDKPMARTVVPQGDFFALIAQYDWDVSVAYAVMMAESEGNPYAVNWNDHHRGCVGSYGLFQIACLHESNPDVLLNAEYNIKRAHALWQQSGWTIWGAYTDGRYAGFLP